MTIEKHGNKWRIKEMVDGVTYRLSVNEKPSKRDAQRMINELIESQDVPVKNIKNFESAANMYIDSKSNILSASTIRGYKTILRSLPDSFKHTKISSITPLDVQEIINIISADHTPKTVRNYHGFISAVLGDYRPNMHLSTILPQKIENEQYTPTEDDINHILDIVSGTRYEIPYRLGCYGLRRSEICALTAADLDDDNKLHINKAKVQQDGGKWIIKQTTKTTKSRREIKIDSALANMIREQEGYLFDGYPNRLNDHLKEIQKRLNLPRFRFHDLRAYFASKAHAMGIPDVYIMEMGGWKSDNVMKRTYRRSMKDKTLEMNEKYTEIFS